MYASRQLLCLGQAPEMLFGQAKKYFLQSEWIFGVKGNRKGEAGQAAARSRGHLHKVHVSLHLSFLSHFSSDNI